MPLTGQNWSTVDSLALRWLCYEDEYIVYNASSGDLHLLNPVAAQALKILEESKITLEDLTKQVALQLDIEVGVDLERHIHHFLLKLARLGMICPSAC
jgi:PqqD family protein of HPr-rel-A system